ncbi:thioredoxin-like protein [Hyaloraphidium curvatum]|nr:thioredoxin-like protein [Hyaloraphidium curvatum]
MAPLPGILQFITSLVDGDGKPVPADVLDSLRDKAVGLYFSALWCPPCRQFAPMLADYASARSKDLAIVYVSNDHSEPEFLKNIAGKPFLAVPYADLRARQILSTALEIASIPTLAVCEPGTGLVVSFGGREEVTYHKMRRAEDPLAKWVGKGAKGNLEEQEEERKRKEAEGGEGGQGGESSGFHAVWAGRSLC